MSTFRPEQVEFAREIDRRLSPKAIVLAEASTGIGKGRVLARLAGKHPKTILAAPTTKVLAQDLAEYDHLRRTQDYPQARVYLGRGNFVSQYRLQSVIADILEDADHDRSALGKREREAAKLAQIWLERGAGGESEAASVLRRHLPIPHFLLADLRAAAPDFPHYEVVLTDKEHPEDRGAKAYFAMRSALHGRDKGPIFTTHAALIWDQRLRWQAEQRGLNLPLDAELAPTLLPDHKLLLIDEAHQLAGVAESAFSKTVALRSVLRALAKPDPWRSARLVKKAKESIPALTRISKDLSALALEHDDGADLATLAQPILRRALRALKPLERVSVSPESACVLDLIDMSKQLIRGGTTVTITHSPVYRYPSLMIGPMSLHKFWAQFWDRVDRAVLTSATIYLVRTSTTYSAAQLTRTLNLPKERVVTMPPVIAPWLTSAVRLESVFDCPHLYLPPNSKSKTHAADTDAWHAIIAERIKSTWKTARGGTLVLCTSYDTIDALKTLLGARNADIIAQERGRFTEAEAAFRRRYALGHRPLWLTTAQAWTGLDLRQDGIAPEDDFLFTDLVIPRVPLGTDRTRIHQNRVNFNSWVEWDRAAMQFRQGIGRLIRDPGLRDRRLIVLDGRIWLPKYRGLLSTITAVLARYRGVPCGASSLKGSR